jgi:hypothetical protein
MHRPLALLAIPQKNLVRGRRGISAPIARGAETSAFRNRQLAYRPWELTKSPTDNELLIVMVYFL